ncbi:MAG: cytochrome c biogenesis protein ResB [Thermodesulfobacteriota bacterium]
MGTSNKTVTAQKKSTGRRKRSFGGKVWSLLSSVKVTIALLGTLATVSIIGTVIQQNQPVSFYAGAYGEKWTNFIFLGGFNDMFHAPWFQALLIFLVVNIVVCTYERFPAKWKSTLEVRESLTPRFIANLSLTSSFYADGAEADAKQRVTEILQKRKYKVTELNGKEGEQLYATKGMIGRFGSDCVHVALLVIILGAFMGSVIGFRGYLVAYPGVTRPVENAGFDVRLDDFWIDYYDTGQIKQYYSILTVIDDGEEVVKGEKIWVNKPLTYNGVTLYQSNYGVAWDKIEAAQFAFKGTDDENPGTPFNVKWDETVEAPVEDFSVKLVGYVSDFGYDQQSKSVFAKSGEPNNPAVQVEIYHEGELASTPWIFLNYPGLFSNLPGTDLDLIFMGYRGIQYSGLSTNRDPGAKVVWVGSTIMVIGFILSFFVFHRRVWVMIKRDEDKATTDIHVGGMINKNRFLFGREFDEIVKEIKGKV